MAILSYDHSSRTWIKTRYLSRNNIPFSWVWTSVIGFLSKSVVFFGKNEQIRDLLKKRSDSLIRLFLVSDLSDWLMHGC